MEGYSNLSTILMETGQEKEARVVLEEAIRLNKDYAVGYYSLSIMKEESELNNKEEYLFSEEILNNQNKFNKIQIYFARANILHKKGCYNESAKYLDIANKIKLDIYKSDINYYLKRSEILLEESNSLNTIEQSKLTDKQSIFIVGMPRSGSTLIESIISMNYAIDDLGETNILEESYYEWLKAKGTEKENRLEELYLSKINDSAKNTTNKLLYNYQYVGVIASQIPNSKIIHCLRNPLDNLLSIYKANFANGNTYSSSLRDAAILYIQHEKVMAHYKSKYPDKIFEVNYDELVLNPSKEIRSLISWLELEWNDLYLSPQLNKRAIKTASKVQARAPINSRSLKGWIKYKEMLHPAIKIFTQTEKYRYLLE